MPAPYVAPEIPACFSGRRATIYVHAHFQSSSSPIALA
jgi:hypothetical protein